MRTLGGLEMSVGTSLAFESESFNGMFGSVDAVLVNIHTVLRNAGSAFDEPPETIDVDLLFSAARDDITKLTKILISKQGSRSINFILYCPSYSGLSREFNKADLWVPTKPKQILKRQLDNKVITKINKEYGSLIVSTDCKLPQFAGTGIILSHHPVDLVMTSAASRLLLLESYTGNVKASTKWYTKLTGNGSELFNMPLNKLTIQVFGDKSTNFKSSTLAIKNLVKQVALDGRWTSATTKERVKNTISNLTSGVDKAGLLMLLK